MTVSRPRMAATAGLALALHGFALWTLRHAKAPAAPPAAAQAPRLQAVLLIAEPAHRPFPDTGQPAAPRSNARKPQGRPRSALAPAAPLKVAPEAAPANAAPPQPHAPTTTGSAAVQFLDSAASQRAIREAAATLGTHAPHPNLWENAIQSASHGDCMKGKFAGSNMGLLSLPVLAVAMARGKCRQ